MTEIGIILGSTRPNPRRADRPLFYDIALKRDGPQFEVVDLRD